MNCQPTLSGNLITLRPLMIDDYEALYGCASDPLIWDQHPEPTRYQREVFLKFFEAAILSRGALAIIDQKTGGVIGTSRYYGLLPEKNQVTIGYTFLARACWGGKFNTELKALMLKHAFQWVDTVQFDIGAENKRSRKAVEKLGAKLCDFASLEKPTHVFYQLQKKDYERSS